MNRISETDKRRYIRYEVLDYAMVCASSAPAAMHAVIVDIGLGGLQLRSRHHVPVGEQCQVHVGRIDLPPLVLRGEVRHSFNVPDSDLIATGIRFLPRTHEERMAIAEYVHAAFQRQCDLLVW